MAGPLIVAPEDVAADLLIANPDAAMLATITAAIVDAQADVIGYLGRAIFPETKVEHNCWPYPLGWHLAEDPREIVSTVAETAPITGALTGYYTVTYVWGIDAGLDDDCAPIRRWVKAAAANAPAVLRAWQATGAKGTVKSVSTEGQSISYNDLTAGGGGAAGVDSPGALPPKSTLDQWRRAGRRAHTPPTPLPAHGPGSFATGYSPYWRRW